MKYLIQIDFPHNGPFGKEMLGFMAYLAKDIANEAGLEFKIWTENEETKEAGGIYVFNNLEDANRYLDKHTKRLQSFGYDNIKAKIFNINEELSVLSKASFLKN
ncbi:monooxygenase [Halarcobacter bivalviorum]|uniref:Monooxygenase n=1 Tax=Halarcobacter bivalviorum TaxID=663364 RepID=A0AAX2A4P6_9BACT|nr:monooxygenase [Halarcobacter bivalviorum]AXH13026.1 putative monooxygenase YdhR [Halarcobacter bivalviorum]RXK09169.1 monooxygenase [Halarcobacter bivalviorum]